MKKIISGDMALIFTLAGCTYPMEEIKSDLFSKTTITANAASKTDFTSIFKRHIEKKTNKYGQYIGGIHIKPIVRGNVAYGVYGRTGSMEISIRAKGEQIYLLAFFRIL